VQRHKYQDVFLSREEVGGGPGEDSKLVRGKSLYIYN